MLQCCRLWFAAGLQGERLSLFFPEMYSGEEKTSLTYRRREGGKKQKSSCSGKQRWKHVASDHGGAPLPLENGVLLGPAGYLSEQGPQVSV